MATIEGRRLALASALARHCKARVPVVGEDLLAAARLVADDGELAEKHRVVVDPTYPGRTAGPDHGRMVFACALGELDGTAIGTAYTTLIPGRAPTVSVAPPVH